LIKVYKHEAGSTQCFDRVDPAWLAPASGATIWVDLDHPTTEEARSVLVDVFKFHELAVEDAISEIHHPKVESYGEYLYVILHGIDFKAREHCFQTQDIDFFVGPNYLVTVHPGVSRSIGKVSDICARNARVLSDGPAGLLHRIVDTMVDNYRPEVDKLHERLDTLEKEVFHRPDVALGRQILNFKRDVASLRRVVLPQRDVVGRLARREFPMINEALSYRFRDVYDHLVRLADEATLFHDRVTSLMEAHLSTLSNQLNSVMKVLTVIATIFMPLTVLTGLYGMNVKLPHLPGGEQVQFWWVFVIMIGVSVMMLWFFRRRRWI
jgi:magnesium transporter